MVPQPTVFPALIVGLGALAACRAPAVESDLGGDVNELVTHGQFEEAVLAAEREVRAHPGDPVAAERHRLASAAWLLEQARRACFENRDEEALEKVRLAAAIAPEQVTVQSWNDKLLDKLCERHLQEASEWYAQYNLESARESYEKALTYRPEDPRAKQALSIVLLQLNHRAGMGEKYYQEGVHLLREYWLEQARSRFDYTRKYQPGNDRALMRGEQVRRNLSDQRATLALALERDGKYAAARNEFRIALLLVETHPEAEAGLERTKKEEKAAELLRQAEMLRLRGRYDEADEIVVEAEDLSESQKDRAEGIAAGIEESRFQKLYDAALAQESDQHYEEAVVLYGKLLEQATYFRDAIARKETLESYIRKAAELYGAAQAAGTQEEKVRILRQVEVFWPEYKDTKKLLDLLAPPEKPRR